MDTARDTQPRTWSPLRWSAWGFIVGVGVTVPATFLALVAPTGEDLHPYLVPGSELLRPLSDAMATWPGLATVAIAALVNGAIYAAGVGALATVVATMRRSTVGSS